MDTEKPRKKSFNKRNKQSKPNKKSSTPRTPDISSLSDARALSATVIYEVCVNQKSLNTLLPIASQHVDEKDRALLQEMVFGTCRWLLWLKTLYQPLLSKPIHRNDFLVESLLSVGIYQRF